MILTKLIESYKARFEISDNDVDRETFAGELNYESGKSFYLVIIFGVMLLPFIPQDLQMHPHPIFAISIKLSIALLSTVLVLLRLTARFKNKPKLLLTTMLIYIYVSVPLIMASSGAYSAVYVSTFAAAFLVPAFTPLTFRFKATLIAYGLAIFVVASLFFGIDLSDVATQKAVATLFLISAFSLVTSYSQHKLRYNTWQQYRALKTSQANEIENQRKNLEMAEESNRAKSRFLARMSHEMRTPMNAVRGIAEIELQKNIHNPETEIAFSRIHNSSGLLLSIINDILDISKVEAGKMELASEVYGTTSMIVDTIQLNSMYIGDKRIGIDVRVDENLPRTLIGDEVRVKQVLNNLLSNAFKYTDEGIVKLSIHVEDHLDDVMLIISISDDGHGMSQDELEVLFDEFYRSIHEKNRIIEGSGLGLAITHQLVHIMGGKIDVESEVGEGTTFTVHLPQKKHGNEVIGSEVVENLKNRETALRYQKKQTKREIQPMPYGRVLVVDDVETNLFVAEGFLTAYEISVDFANSGAEAVAKIKSGEIYDIIFMDHMMPGMDGVEATKIIRELGYDHPIVALTANAFSDSMKMFMENGFSGYASKPIDFEQMDVILKRFIRDKHEST